MIQLVPSRSVCPFLESLPVKQLSQVMRKVGALLKDPRPADSIKIGEHKGFTVFRADCGEYRIVYSFDKLNLYLWVVDRRNDMTAYKVFDRMKS